MELAKDLDDEKCICTRLKEALEKDDYDTASDLQLEMMKKSPGPGKGIPRVCPEHSRLIQSAKAEHQANDDPFLTKDGSFYIS